MTGVSKEPVDGSLAGWDSKVRAEPLAFERKKLIFYKIYINSLYNSKQSMIEYQMKKIKNRRVLNFEWS